MKRILLAAVALLSGVPETAAELEGAEFTLSLDVQSGAGAFAGGTGPSTPDFSGEWSFSAYWAWWRIAASRNPLTGRHSHTAPVGVAC